VAKWFCFTVFFLCIVAVSFAGFIWNYRVDLTESLLSKICSPHRAKIGQVEIHKKAIRIKDIKIISETGRTTSMEYIRLVGSPVDLFFYLVFPSSRGLTFEKIQFSSSPTGLFSALTTLSQHLSVKEVEIGSVEENSIP
jgi:hypothetical protein